MQATNPAEGLVSYPLQSHLFKVLHEEVGSNWDIGKSTATSSVSSQNWSLKLKKEELRIWQKSLRLSSS
jgi:hypothetical protein